MYYTFLLFKPCLDEKIPATIEFVKQWRVQKYGSNVRMKTNRKANFAHNDSGKGNMTTVLRMQECYPVMCKC